MCAASSQALPLVRYKFLLIIFGDEGTNQKSRNRSMACFDAVLWSISLTNFIIITCIHVHATCTHTTRSRCACTCRCGWCDIDEGVEVVSELVEEVTEIAFSIVYSHYLEEQAFPHSVNDAKHSLIKIIEV